MATNVDGRSKRGTKKGRQSLRASTNQRTRGSRVVVAEGFTYGGSLSAIHGVRKWWWRLDEEQTYDRSQQGRQRLQMSSTMVAAESVDRVRV